MSGSHPDRLSGGIVAERADIVCDYGGLPPPTMLKRQTPDWHVYSVKSHPMPK